MSYFHTLCKGYYAIYNLWGFIYHKMFILVIKHIHALIRTVVWNYFTHIIVSDFNKNTLNRYIFYQNNFPRYKWVNNHNLYYRIHIISSFFAKVCVSYFQLKPNQINVMYNNYQIHKINL